MYFDSHFNAICKLFPLKSGAQELFTIRLTSLLQQLLAGTLSNAMDNEICAKKRIQRIFIFAASLTSQRVFTVLAFLLYSSLFTKIPCLSTPGAREEKRE